MIKDKETVSKEKYDKLRKLAWDMCSKMKNLSTDLRPLRASMEEFHHFICFKYETSII